MECRDYQRRINDYVNDKMSKKDLYDFLKHISNCEECREEYEFYYNVYMGFNYLDDNIVGFTTPEEKLESSRQYLRDRTIILIEKIICFVIIFMGILLLL